MEFKECETCQKQWSTTCEDCLAYYGTPSFYHPNGNAIKNITYDEYEELKDAILKLHEDVTQMKKALEKKGWE